jgi:hypothetical protein
MNNYLPFEESWISDKISLRSFSPDLIDEELKWHIDMEDRVVEILNDNDWKFQFDDQLPIKMEGTIEIKMGEWHRIIKGSTPLNVKITRST